MSKIVVGADTETFDPLLRTSGYSWKYGKGYILCTALYYEATKEKKVIAGLNYANSPYTKEEIKEMNNEVIRLLKNPDVMLVGANLMYDISWWLYEYNMTVYDIKCSLVDVLIAESSINEFEDINLDNLSLKYLKHGKSKTNIEEWVFNNVQNAKDFRKYLKDAPWNLLCEYVLGDAEYPVQIWRKQLTELKEQNLATRVKLDFDCILPILQITINGFPIDMEKKQKNLELLTSYRDKLKEEFTEKYGINLSVNSSNQLAKFFDSQKIPYRVKITLKGQNGLRFADYKEIDTAYSKAKKIVSSFRYVKRIPVAYVPSELADRTLELLKEEGFDVISSPNIDKRYFASAREEYPIVGVIADWKLANGIISKILGEHYNQFIALDKDNVYRTHGQYHITKAEGAGTISSRLSSSMSNMQQIPSKGGFTIHDNEKEIEVSFPKLTRALFVPEKGGVLFKIDYSQLEYRLICHCAVGEGSEEVRKQFNENPHLDFHQYVVDLTGLSRKYAKNMSFGVSFGMGLKSMAENFGWTMEKAQEISDAYHHHMPFVQPTLELVGDVAKQRGYIKTVCGSRARLRNPNLSYTMLNRFTQGSGADILKSAVRRAYNEGVWKDLKIHVTVHDELDGTVYPTEEQIKRVIQLEDIMSNTIPLRVPLLAEAELGMNWNDVKEPSEWWEMKEKEPEKWKSLPEELKEAVTLYIELKAC